MDEPAWYQRRAVMGLQFLPPVLVAAFFVVVRRRTELARDIAKARRLRAPKSARTAVRRAEQAIQANQPTVFYEAMWEALASYFGNRLNLAPGQVSCDVVLTTMRGSGLEPVHAESLEKLFSTCEHERFGHEGDMSADPGNMTQLLHDLDRLLKICERIRI